MFVETKGSPVPYQAPAPSSGPAGKPDRLMAPVPDPQELQRAVSAANAAFKALSNNLEFSVDDQTGRSIVRVVDTSTGQVIRQLPSPEMLAIAKAIDRLQGLLLRDRA